jgi:hypothetical protein
MYAVSAEFAAAVPINYAFLTFNIVYLTVCRGINDYLFIYLLYMNLKRIVSHDLGGLLMVLLDGNLVLIILTLSSTFKFIK